jgi:hypothetical protein
MKSAYERRLRLQELIIGATRTGALTPALLEKEFNDFGVIQQAKYKNRGINTSKEYAAWRLAGNEPLESGVGGAHPWQMFSIRSISKLPCLRAFNCQTGIFSQQHS